MAGVSHPLRPRTIVQCEDGHHLRFEVSGQYARKVADALASVLDAPVEEPDDVDLNALSEYDLIGLSSGIYSGNHDERLSELVDAMPNLNANAFIFSTSGRGRAGRYHKSLKERLESKGIR